MGALISEVKMDCPNGHGEMESAQYYLEVGSYGCTVVVWICQECQYREAEAQ